MDETIIDRYTFDLQGIGTILAPGKPSQRPTVLQGTTENPLDGNDALALVRALDILAKDKRVALAVRREINRLHDPAEYAG